VQTAAATPPPAAAPAQAPAPPAKVAAAAPAPSPAQTADKRFKVQLGSYSTADNAHRAGADLVRDHPKPMLGHDVVVSQASAKGKGYFLVVVQGFAERAEADAFCKAVASAPSGCLIRR
jgi:cell division protein FtsN